MGHTPSEVHIRPTGQQIPRLVRDPKFVTCSQQAVTGPHPEPVESSQHPLILLLYDSFLYSLTEIVPKLQ